jgi:hypothetical protein
MERGARSGGHRRVQTSTTFAPPKRVDHPRRQFPHKRESSSPAIDVGKHASPVAVMRLCKREDIMEKEEKVKERMKSEKDFRFH